MSLVVRTFQFIRESMITPDHDDQKKLNVKQTNGDLTDNKKINKFATVNIRVPGIGAADVFFTMPRSLYAANKTTGILENGSIGPNLMDLDNNLKMSSAFSGGWDRTMNVHTSVRNAIESADNPQHRRLMVLTALRIHNDAIRKANDAAEKMEKERGKARDQEQEKLAYAMRALWGGVYERFASIGDESGGPLAMVVPLAHSHTTGLGFATFQLLVTFKESFLREAAAGAIDDVASKQKWGPIEQTKAWMGVLLLLLDGVNGAKKIGEYYTLEWTTKPAEEPSSHKSEFGRKYR